MTNAHILKVEKGVMANPQFSGLRNWVDENFNHHKKGYVAFLDICGKFKWTECKDFSVSAFIQEICIKFLLGTRYYFNHIEIEIEIIRFNHWCIKQEDCRQNRAKYQPLRKGQKKSNFLRRPRRKIQRGRIRTREKIWSKSTRRLIHW